MSVTDLRYDIARRTLTGKIDGTHVSAIAGSGGRAGSKVRGAENWWLSGKALAGGVGGASNRGTHAFGPLPIGRYTLSLHETKKNWIRLSPERSNVMFGRTGFAIHGRGTVGSHGCIVPTDFNVLLLLCRLLERRATSGGGAVTLQVVATGQDLGVELTTA